MDLEKDCRLGYSLNYLKTILTDEQYQALSHWMRGQTMAICDGRKWNHIWERYEFTECVNHPHGTVIYEHDFLDWYLGLPVTDW